jgi:hypothetical protein
MLSLSRCTKWALVLGLPLAVLSSCSRQGPGERCDTSNGSNDCDDGLVCTPKETLRGTSSLCCPKEQTGPESIVVGCTYGAATTVSDAGSTATGDGASTSAEAGFDGALAADAAATADAAVDSANDATTAASGDASADANVDASVADAGTDTEQ